MAVPYGVPASFDEHIKLQFDLLALAFQGDITRVSTLLYARDLTGRVYPESGTNVSFHGASHHRRRAEPSERVRQAQPLSRADPGVLRGEAAVDSRRDGTLLDHSLVLYGSNMGNSNQHLHYDVPHVLIGGASGRLEGGRHLVYPSRTVTSGNLLLSIMDVYDVRHDSIGDGADRLVGL